MSGHFVLSCDCLFCREVGPAQVCWTTGYDISSARGIARSETHSPEERWTGDGESDYAPGHELADMDDTNQELLRVEERAQLIRLRLLSEIAGGRTHRSWRDLSELDRRDYRARARRELLADRKRVRGLG